MVIVENLMLVMLYVSLKECNMLPVTVWEFDTVKNEPKLCSLIQIFLFNMFFSL